MRKPELEPVIPTDTDTDTTPDIPDIPDVPADTAPSGGGGPSLPDTPYSGPEDASGLPELPQLPESQAAPSAGGGGAPSLPEASGGGDSGSGDLPELPEEEQDLEETKESLQEYLDQLDPEEFDTLVQEVLDRLQQLDYSGLSGEYFPDLTPEEADTLVHDMLTELQQQDYAQVLTEFREFLSGETVDGFWEHLNGTLHDMGTGDFSLPALPEFTVPDWILETEHTLRDFFLVDDSINFMDNAFNVNGWIKKVIDYFKFDNLLPGILSDYIFKNIGLKDALDNWLKNKLDLNKDGKASALESLARNVMMLLAGKAVELPFSFLFEKLLKKLGVGKKAASLRALTTHHLPNLLTNLRRNFLLHMEAVRYLREQEADEQARQEQLAQLDREEAEALAAAEQEAAEKQEADRVYEEELAANEKAEQEALEENARLEQEAREQADAQYKADLEQAYADGTQQEQQRELDELHTEAYREAARERMEADQAAHDARFEADQAATEKHEEAYEAAEANRAKADPDHCQMTTEEIHAEYDTKRQEVNERYDRAEAYHAERHEENVQQINESADKTIEERSQRFSERAAEPSLPEAPEKTAGEEPSLPNNVSNDVVESDAPTKGHTGLGL